MFKGGTTPLLTWQPTDADGLGKGVNSVAMQCGNLAIAGDIKVVFYVRDATHKLLQFWFNTAFVRQSTLVLRLVSDSTRICARREWRAQ